MDEEITRQLYVLDEQIDRLDRRLDAVLELVRNLYTEREGIRQPTHDLKRMFEQAEGKAGS